MFYFDESGEWSGQQTISSRTDSLWVDLSARLNQTRPRTIALNDDPDLSFAGGLHAGYYKLLVERVSSSMDGTFMDRLVSR